MTISILELGGATVVGAGATLVMDIWAVVSQRYLGTTPANYCLVGRWFCHMPAGEFIHRSIAKATQKPGECLVGWLAHYLIGIAYAVALVALTSGKWIYEPTFWVAILFGLATLFFPFFIMQPSFGLGIASSRSSNPTQARLKSLVAHAVFGIGLYLATIPVNHLMVARTL